MITLSQLTSEKQFSVKINSGVYSLGLVIPFQPSMVDKKTVQEVLNYALELVQAKLERFNEEEKIKVTRRLKRIFSNLNFSSHRKSVAIIIEGKKEKTIHLNYSGNSVILVNDNCSLLDLISNSKKSPEFELLVFKRKGAVLYEYFNNSLHKVFEQSQHSCNEMKSDPNCLFRRLTNILKRVNRKNDKPIFVFSEDDQLTDDFCDFFPFKEIAFKIKFSSNDDPISKISLLADKIFNQWEFYQTKLVKGQIAIAKRSQTLYASLEEVIAAMQDSNSGILLIDSFMKDEIRNKSQDNSFIKATQKLNDEIEKFLSRGNGIEITTGGALENLEGIAFIKDSQPKFEVVKIRRKYNQEDLIF